MGGFEDLAGDTVSAEDLASGKVQVDGEGRVAENQDSQEPMAGSFDSAVIEERLRASLTQPEPTEPKEEEPAAKEEGEEEETHEEEEPKPRKGGKKDRSAQARIIELVNQRKESDAKAAQLQQEVIELNKRLAQQMEAQQARLVDLEQKRLQLAQEDKSKAELAAMSEPDRRVYEFKQQLKAEMVKEFQPLLDARDKEIAELKQWKGGAEEYAKKSQREREVTQMVDNALNSVVFKGFTPEEAEGLRPVMHEMTALFAAAYGWTPEQVAPELTKYLDKWVQVRTAQIARSGKNKLGKGGKVPPPPVTGKASTQVEDTRKPSLEEIRKLGYSDFVRYNVDRALGRLKKR